MNKGFQQTGTTTGITEKEKEDDNKSGQHQLSKKFVLPDPFLSSKKKPLMLERV